MLEQTLNIKSNFYIETNNKIKYFNFKKNKNNNENIGSYFVIPIIYELDFNNELFIKNIKRFQQNKNKDYFDYTSNYVDLSQLYYHSQTNKYLLSLKWNITKKLNINFQDIYNDFENQIKLTQYYNNTLDNYGDFKILKSFIKVEEVEPTILNKEKQYEMIKEELLFNNINTEIELDNIIYKVCIFDDNNFEIIPWYEITETNLKYNQLFYLGENITTDNEKQFIEYLDMFKIYLEELNTYFVIGDYLLQINPKQINKLLSNTSDLIINFESIQNVDYDDFSISPEIIGKNEIISNTTKIIYLETKKSLWNEYKQQFKLLQDKSNLLEKIKHLKQFVISQNYPTYLMKGSQPNKFYEEFFQSPFIDNKSLITIKENNKYLNHFCDYGLIFKELLNSSMKRLKVFIPDTVSFIIQESYDDMRLDLQFNQDKYEEFFNKNENRKSDNFGIIKDELIGEFTIDDIINLYISDKQEKIKILNKNNIPKQKQQRIQNQFQKLMERFEIQGKIDKNIQFEEKYSKIKNYLHLHGFNINSNSQEIYGFLNSFCKQDFFKSNKTLGLICYSNPQIDMFFFPEQYNFIKTDYLYQINLLVSYNIITLNYSSIFYISNEDISNYRQQYSNNLQNLSDFDVENLMYKEFFEFFLENDNIYIPIIFKINVLGKLNEYYDKSLKFSITDIQPYYYGKTIKTTLNQDFDDYQKQFNYEEIYEIPQRLHFIRNFDFEIPQVYSSHVIQEEEIELPFYIKQY